jgi:cobalt-zinc-cadmium efflux system outer membrane protein
LALERHPSLAAFSEELRAAEAKRLQAGARSNPELGLEMENVSGNLPGFSRSETTLSLGQVLELGGKRSARIRAARAEEEVRAGEWEAQKLAVLAVTARRFIDTVFATGLVSLQEDEVRIAEQVRASVAQKVRAGAVSPAEALRAELELSSARLDLLDLQEELSLSRERLGSLWLEADPSTIVLDAVLDSARTLPSRESLEERIETSPELARLAREVAAREARIELARAQRAPDLELELGYRRLQEEEANTLVGGLRVPLPLFDRNQGSIAAAEAEARRAQAEMSLGRIELDTALAESHSRASRAGARARALTRDLLPTAERAFEEIREGYEQGRFSYVDLLEARRALTGVRRQRIQALTQHHLAVVDLELLLGSAVFPSGSFLEGSKP